MWSLSPSLDKTDSLDKKPNRSYIYGYLLQHDLYSDSKNFEPYNAQQQFFCPSGGLFFADKSLGMSTALFLYPQFINIFLLLLSEAFLTLFVGDSHI